MKLNKKDYADLELGSFSIIDLAQEIDQDGIEELLNFDAQATGLNRELNAFAYGGTVSCTDSCGSPTTYCC